MAAPVVLRLLTGTPRTGLPCNTCGTAQRAEIDLIWLDPGGMTLIGTGSGCAGCGQHSATWYPDDDTDTGRAS